MKDNEYDGYRPRPSVPYRLVEDVLKLPPKALELTLDVCRASGRLETCCFWYGRADDGGRSGNGPVISVVTTVVVPRQRQTWGNYSVTSDAMREIHRRIGSRRIQNLAQAHSHPSIWVEHSVYDDEMANSRDALSIVVPHYGRWSSRWPFGIGVHEFQDEHWHLLTESDAARRVILAQGAEVDFVDCR